MTKKTKTSLEQFLLDIKNLLAGWYVYDLKQQTIAFKEEYIPNENDDRVWFFVETVEDHKTGKQYIAYGSTNND